MKLEELQIEQDQKGSGRVLYGGSWIFVASGARAAWRISRVPDRRSDFIGFRLVRNHET